MNLHKYVSALLGTVMALSFFANAATRPTAKKPAKPAGRSATKSKTTAKNATAKKASARKVAPKETELVMTAEEVAQQQEARRAEAARIEADRAEAERAEIAKAEAARQAEEQTIDWKVDHMTYMEKISWLESVKKTLKSEFVAWDTTIESVMAAAGEIVLEPASVKKPFVFPLITLPGYGKTTFVQRFVELMGWDRRFAEIKLQKHKGVLPIAEVQKFRKVKGQPVRGAVVFFDEAESLDMDLAAGQGHSINDSREKLITSKNFYWDVLANGKTSLVPDKTLPAAVSEISDKYEAWAKSKEKVKTSNDLIVKHGREISKLENELLKAQRKRVFKDGEQTPEEIEKEIATERENLRDEQDNLKDHRIAVLNRLEALQKEFHVLVAEHFFELGKFAEQSPESLLNEYIRDPRQINHELSRAGGNASSSPQAEYQHLIFFVAANPTSVISSIVMRAKAADKDGRVDADTLHKLAGDLAKNPQVTWEWFNKIWRNYLSPPAELYVAPAKESAKARTAKAVKKAVDAANEKAAVVAQADGTEPHGDIAVVDREKRDLEVQQSAYGWASRWNLRDWRMAPPFSRKQWHQLISAAIKRFSESVHTKLAEEKIELPKLHFTSSAIDVFDREVIDPLGGPRNAFSNFGGLVGRLRLELIANMMKLEAEKRPTHKLNIGFDSNKSEWVIEEDMPEYSEWRWRNLGPITLKDKGWEMRVPVGLSLPVDQLSKDQRLPLAEVELAVNMAGNATVGMALYQSLPRNLSRLTPLGEKELHDLWPRLDADHLEYKLKAMQVIMGGLVAKHIYLNEAETNELEKADITQLRSMAAGIVREIETRQATFSFRKESDSALFSQSLQQDHIFQRLLSKDIDGALDITYKKVAKLLKKNKDMFASLQKKLREQPDVRPEEVKLLVYRHMNSDLGWLSWIPFLHDSKRDVMGSVPGNADPALDWTLKRDLDTDSEANWFEKFFGGL